MKICFNQNKINSVLNSVEKSNYIDLQISAKQQEIQQYLVCNVSKNEFEINNTLKKLSQKVIYYDDKINDLAYEIDRLYYKINNHSTKDESTEEEKRSEERYLKALQSELAEKKRLMATYKQQRDFALDMNNSLNKCKQTFLEIVLSYQNYLNKIKNKLAEREDFIKSQKTALKYAKSCLEKYKSINPIVDFDNSRKKIFADNAEYILKNKLIFEKDKIYIYRKMDANGQIDVYRLNDILKNLKKKLLLIESDSKVFQNFTLKKMEWDDDLKRKVNELVFELMFNINLLKENFYSNSILIEEINKIFDQYKI